LSFAIANHPWVDSSDGADVSIAMTVATNKKTEGRLLTLEHQNSSNLDGVFDLKFSERRGMLKPDLRVGPSISSSTKLTSNDEICYRGMIPHGSGFFVPEVTYRSLSTANSKARDWLKKYFNNSEMMGVRKNRYVIDFYGLSKRDAEKAWPIGYQILLDKVYPKRKENPRKSRRENWWIFAENQPSLRKALKKLNRYIGTGQTSKHRVFTFVPNNYLPDDKVVVIASDKSDLFSILSSVHHTIWALSAGALNGPTPVYNNTECFDPYPFPDLSNKPKLQSHLADLGERLDKHRKDRQADHPKLTLTQMYNVLEKVRTGEMIEGKDKIIYDQGLIGILKQIHDDIDEATAEAYGWPNDLTDEEVLQRLVDLNRERALEEAKGHVRWLRPEYQNPDGHAAKAKSGELALEDASLPDAVSWPKALPEQMAAVRQALLDAGQANVEDIRSQFKGARTITITERLDTLAALGQAELLKDGRYAA